MVEVTRLNGQCMVINGDMIEQIEAKPDTILSLTSGRKLIVRESVAEVVRRMVDYRNALKSHSIGGAIMAGASACHLSPGTP